METSKEERLQLALDAARLGTFVWYAEDRGEPDERMLELFNLPKDGTLSLSAALASMIHPDDRGRYADAVAAAFDPGGARELREDIRVMQSHGGYHWVAVTARAFFTGDPPVPYRLVGVAADVTERYEAEARRDFLFTVSETLRALTDPAEIKTRSADLLGRHLSVSRALYLDVTHEPDSDYYVVERDFHDPGVASIAGRYRADDFGAGLFAEWRAGRAITVTDVRTDARVSEAERLAYPATDVRAFAAVPLVKEGSHVATLMLHQSTPRTWQPGELALVEEVAERTWAAVERAQAEKELRQSELRFREVVEVAPQLVWVGRCDGSVEFANENWTTSTGVDPDGMDHWAMLTAAAHPDEAAGLRADLAQAEARCAAFEGELRLRQRSGGFRWFLMRIVPLSDGAGSVLKWFGVATDIDDRRRADEVLREEEHQVALRLQRALLPRAVESPAGTAVCARYEAGTVALEVGGDWYDAFALPDGQLAITVGDVVGHGLDAAIAMGTLRVAMAALAPHSAGPGELLSQFDRFAREVDGAHFATACYAQYDPASGRLRYASAGHPPMLVIDADGSARWLDGGRSGPLAGKVDDQRPDATDLLEPGATLVLYSDGLIERRREPITVGLERLARAAVELHHLPVEQFCGQLISALGGERQHTDDIVVLCLRAVAQPYRRELRADATELSGMRRSLTAWCAVRHVADTTVARLMLAVGEAAANAIEHAYLGQAPRSVSVTVSQEPDGTLVATIADTGSWRSPAHPGSDRGRGILIMRRVSDTFERHTTAGGTTIRLRLSPNGPAA
ncbi:SpoIIE family protein phosphatase [Catellatospora methionotrophica]|uniref:SpoIIE family protein phosphatase n=1 Tax=Catellatospora methionotrophica TaxID=121620 RepID=UPI0033E402C6